jgi:hypothetical protein
VRVGRRWAVTAVPAVAFTLVAVVLAACGDSDEARATKAEWERRHGAAVGEVGRALDRVQAATKEGEPVGIRTNCEALRESVQEARAALPVPDAAADAALRQALDTMSTGVSDCLRAMASGDARQLERSIVELRDARLHLDTAQAALAR